MGDVEKLVDLRDTKFYELRIFYVSEGNYCIVNVINERNERKVKAKVTYIFT